MPIGDDDFWWQSSGSSGSGSSGGSGGASPPPGAGASTPTGAAPTSAQQASDWAAGPRPSGPSTPQSSYNGGIVDNATSYEDRHGQITYGWGSGTDPKLDCSHYTANVIGESDPNFDPKKDYQTTGQLKRYLGDSPPADGMYEKVDPKDVQPGDLVLFGGKSGHVGVVTDAIDPETGKGKYIGSQSSTGVAETNFGPKSGYWGKAGGKETITGYVRYKGKSGANAGSGTKAASSKGGAGAGKGSSGKGDGKAKKPTAKKVTNNDKEIAHKKSQHKATTKAPTDVHKPVGNGGPAPFMNWQWTSKLSAGSIMTFAEKAMIWLKSTGLVGPTETTHPSHNPGVKSGTYKAPAKAVTASKDLKVEGQKVVRETDKTKQNQGNTKGEVVKPPPPAAKAGDGQKKADPANKCLKLGANKKFKDAIYKAADKSGMPPESIASVMNAEAAKKKDGSWDPDSASTSSSAQGLTQFLDGTWLGMATTPGTALNQAAVDKGYVNATKLKNGGTKYSVDKGSKQDLLDMRTDPDMSIMTGAEYDMQTYKSLERAGLTKDNPTATESAQYMYAGHHEGPRDAKYFYGETKQNDADWCKTQLDKFGSKERTAAYAGQEDSTVAWNNYYTKKFNAQVGSKEAKKLIDAEGGDATAAYKKWFQGYMDKKITPDKFACTDEKVDGDEAPAPAKAAKK